MNKNALLGWAVGFAFVLMAGRGFGATILGQVNFTGTVTLDAPLVSATAFTGFSNVEVDAGSGDYAVPSLVPEGTSVAVTSFSFTPFTPPVAPLWAFSVGGTDYEFDLSTLAVSRETIAGNHFLSLSGVGVARITGFEETSGDFTFSAQQAVGAVGTTVTFSMENVVPSESIPEPGVAGLAGLAGLMGLVRRRRQRRLFFRL